MRATCTHHCRTCLSCFTSLAAFDAHRTGPHSKRVCEFPDDPQLIERPGYCEIANPGSTKRVTLYEHANAQKVRDHYAAQRASDSLNRPETED